MNAKELKPFDLQAALNGEPVMLRDGSKAFVRHNETEHPTGQCWQLWGVGSNKRGGTWLLLWSRDGLYDVDGRENELDIIGMWPKTRIINGFEVPAPETQDPEEGTTYYIPILHTVNLYGKAVWYRDEQWHKRYIKRGMVFLNAEDAIANTRAMLGIDPYEEGGKSTLAHKQTKSNNHRQGG